MTESKSIKMNKGPLVLAILIITVGVGWLLTAQGYMKGINWVWTLGLGIVGILTFILSGGLDKFSIVCGPFFLISSVLSILRQKGQLKLEVEVPVLVIVVGVLLFISQMPFIHFPRWFTPLTPSGEEEKSK